MDREIRRKKPAGDVTCPEKEFSQTLPAMMFHFLTARHEQWGQGWRVSSHKGQTVFAVRSGTLGRERERDRGSLCLVSINMLNNPAVFPSWLSHMNM